MGGDTYGLIKTVPRVAYCCSGPRGVVLVASLGQSRVWRTAVEAHECQNRWCPRENGQPTSGCCVHDSEQRSIPESTSAQAGGSKERSKPRDTNSNGAAEWRSPLRPSLIGQSRPSTDHVAPRGAAMRSRIGRGWRCDWFTILSRENRNVRTCWREGRLGGREGKKAEICEMYLCHNPTPVTTTSKVSCSKAVEKY